jgi:N utilization substance protein A
MTAEELGEVPGIGDKTIDKISTAVRHYFGQYEEGEERPAPKEPVAIGPTSEELAEIADEESSMAKTPEEILAAEAAASGEAEEVGEFSSEDIADAEDLLSESDANDDADAREEGIEMDNDTVDTLVAESQEISDETIDSDGHDRG